MNKSIENDILKGEFVKQILSGHHKMKSIMTNQIFDRCVTDYYSKCLEKFIPTDNKHIRHILNLNDELCTSNTNKRLVLCIHFINVIIIRYYDNHIWKYLENIINIPDDEMTPEVIELLQYILKVLY